MAGMEALPYTADLADSWDAFVRISRNGTFFHTRAFLAYHDPKRFFDASLIFAKENTVTGLLPAAAVDEDGVPTLVSHPGASYGGLVLSPKEGMAETGAMIETLIASAKAKGYQRVRLLRLTPPSVRRMSSDDQEYWLYQHGFRVFRSELATSLFVGNTPADEILTRFDGKCRNMVRQAERAGITVRESDDIPAFWTMLETMLQAKHDAKPTHTLEEILRLKELTGNAVRLFGAYLDDQLVAGTIAVTLHDGAIYTLYMAQEYAQQKHHPLHAVLAALAGVCADEGRSVLHFGISTESGGTTVNPGLFFFKESFGGVSVRRDSWHIDL